MDAKYSPEIFAVGGKSYVTHFGYDWLPQTDRTFAALTIAKKWKMFQARDGAAPDADPGDCLEEGLKNLFGDKLKQSPWTVEMIHDFAKEDAYAMIGCGGCGKSHVIAACGIAYWIVDPFDTATIIASSTKTDLATRAWAPTLELFTFLKENNRGWEIPGRVMQGQYAIVNVRDEAVAESMSPRSAIQGRAIDEGRMQGTHEPWVMIAIDELGLVKDIPALETHLANLRIGTLGCKIVFAANPQPWDHPTSKFYIPPKGVSVTPDTGCWRAKSGFWVRHFNGYKSPVVLEPRLKADFPFLMSQDDIDKNLAMCGGDPRHPLMCKMVVGFPMRSGGGTPSVLDPVIASNNEVTAAMPAPISGGRVFIGRAAGVDPAWSEHGDSAIYAGVKVFQQDGRPYLDFGGQTGRMNITTDSSDPVTLQLRKGVSERIRRDNGPALTLLYVDSSGNQGLADDIDVYLGPGCGHINNSERASEAPLRAYDPRRARAVVKDRGTESWVVLAEFCKAGMVKGLPQPAVDGLTQRRFVSRPNSDDPVSPLRLEPKEVFMKRFKGSPNETDACALAALAVKERMGVLPFGSVPEATPEGIFPGAYADEGGEDGFQFIRNVLAGDDDGGGYSDSFDDIGAY